jgi:hypothetical protein
VKGFEATTVSEIDRLPVALPITQANLPAPISSAHRDVCLSNVLGVFVRLKKSRQPINSLRPGAIIDRARRQLCLAFLPFISPV